MVNLRVNRKKYLVEVSPDTPLLWVLREKLDLTSTKFGCGIAQCAGLAPSISTERLRVPVSHPCRLS